MPAPDDEPTTDPDRPGPRQLLHAATGDRDAEARALADRADEDVEAARTAVGRAHGDVAGEPEPARDVATPADAHDAAQERDDRD